ncbi:hypothetical protein XENOCAPTIV_009249 [Xenoophorus captivus]|uniref:Uncharacterized protein n=1 Tax=Xenoophorus captivus TaxID=1517983 RepID=A0ABV0QD06_9TELE
MAGQNLIKAMMQNCPEMCDWSLLSLVIKQKLYYSSCHSYKILSYKEKMNKKLSGEQQYKPGSGQVSRWIIRTIHAHTPSLHKHSHLSKRSRATQSFHNAATNKFTPDDASAFKEATDRTYTGRTGQLCAETSQVFTTRTITV